MGRVIASLNKRIARKSRVHKLTPQHMARRKTACRKLYERCLSGRKHEFVVSLDEAMFGLHNVAGKRKVCYVRKGEALPGSWVVDKDNFLTTFMVVGAICGRGTLPLIRIPKKVKVCAEYYINDVLKPLLEVELPKLYPGELSKIVVHHDMASSHTAKKTQAYARDLKARLGITIIANTDIPVKSPDASPMDFFGFGYLKRRLFKKRPTTRQGLWKLMKEEWTSINQGLVDRTFAAWKRRLRMVSKIDGQHIENTKTIHRRYR